ncbi:hypothetical protein K9M06_00380 [Candidatus Bipolaricaulota bacterium]|nr:hypothetical protein [Candidatus Bipolaricaulota bacterium]
MNSNGEEGPEKLRALLKHGVEHNQDHQEEVRKWAGQAGELGETEAQKLLLEAAEILNKANSTMFRALDELEKGED